MLVNVTDVLTSEGKVVELEVNFEKTAVDHNGFSYPIEDCSTVQCKISNIGEGKALIEAAAELTMLMQCDRCLCDVKQTLKLQISREIVSDISTEEQESFMEGYELNIDSLIENEIMTCWPMKVLCRPDCKGLCPVCGQDLNKKACGCDTFVPDPRMAAIKDVFYANKEV